jgi:hypothetical protein
LSPGLAAAGFSFSDRCSRLETALRPQRKTGSTFPHDAFSWDESIVEFGKPDPLFRTML